MSDVKGSRCERSASKGVAEPGLTPFLLSVSSVISVVNAFHRFSRLFRLCILLLSVSSVISVVNAFYPAFGSVNVNVLPFPTSLSTRIFPPINSTSSFVIGSPNPVPP